jgi:rhodanese-related sulfurtransferase
VFNELKIKEANICGLSTTDSVKLINQNSLIFDIGPAERYAQKHLLGAANKKPEDLTKEELRKTNKKNKPVLLVCDNGNASKKLSLKLRSKGLDNVFYIKGGQTEWENASLPVSSLADQ